MYDEKIISSIKDVLIADQQTIAVAESVTAGHLQVALASAENASKFFQGGITTYNLGQKSRHLQVEPIHALSCNCVSDKIAGEMALNTNKLFVSDWGISITGYAAPMPECSIHDLFAYYAISFQDKLQVVKKINAANAAPMAVQSFYVNTILNDFHALLEKKRAELHQPSFSRSDLNSINSKLTSAGPFKTTPSVE